MRPPVARFHALTAIHEIVLLRLVLIAILSGALLLDPALAMAHELGYPHSDPVPADTDKGGAPSAVVILLGIVMTLVTVAALVWLKNHDFGADDDSADAAAE